MAGTVSHIGQLHNCPGRDVLHAFTQLPNEDSGCSNYGFVFYDKTPGGAGHVRRMQNAKVLECVLREALDTISGCTCGGSELDTSCYSCLRNYYNQKHHELLQRKYVIEFLHELFA